MFAKRVIFLMDSDALIVTENEDDCLNYLFVLCHELGPAQPFLNGQIVGEHSFESYILIFKWFSDMNIECTK